MMKLTSSEEDEADTRLMEYVDENVRQCGKWSVIEMLEVISLSELTVMDRQSGQSRQSYFVEYIEIVS